jgi:nucleoside-diphosphate-sugar epimerase
LEDIKCIKDSEAVTGNICDLHFCETITRNVEVIFNLAALIAIPYSYISPVSSIDININGALNIFLAALENKISRVI